MNPGKVLSVLFFYSFIYSSSIGQTPVKNVRATLSGKILEKDTGKPLAGASVYIHDLKSGAVADTGGNYRFSNLPPGIYLVQVDYVGFKSGTQNVSLYSNTVKNFELSNTTVEEGTVVVTGLSKATLITRSPIPIVAVNHDYLERNLSTNAVDALTKIPGVRAVTTGPNISKPFIRGLGFNRILSLYDGLRQEGQQWGDEHGIEVDQYGIDHVEIIKGPASLSYGSDALAGVVNFIPTQAPPEGKIKGEIITDYQTNNKYFGGTAMLSGNKNNFEWLGRVSHKEAADYQNKIDGRVFGTAFKETDVTASVGLHKKWGYSHINFVLYNDEQEIPDGARDSASRKFTRQISEEDTLREIVPQSDLNSYSIEKIHQLVQHYRLFWSNNITLGQGRLAINLGYQKSIRREFSHPVLYDIPGLYLKLNSYTYDLKYFFPEINGLNFTTGLNGMFQDNNSRNGSDFIIPSYKQFDIGPFVLAKKTFNKLDLSGGIRYDFRSFSNDDFYTETDAVTGFSKPVNQPGVVGAEKIFSAYSKTFSGLSGSMGMAYNFNHAFSVKANIARGFRAPNISEISSNGVHPGTNIFQLGNQNFKPEFSFQQDIGFAYTSKHFLATLDLFNNHISNYIYNQKLLNADGTALVLVPGNETFQFQAARAHLYGGEFSLDIHPIKELHFENSFSVVYGDNKGVAGKPLSSDAKYLPFIPPAHGTSELRFDFSAKNIHAAKGFIKVQAEYYATQDRAYLEFNTETPTKGYTLFNAGIGSSFVNSKGKTLFSIYIMGNNLFDAAYQDHLSRLKYFEDYPDDPRPGHGIYNMGRNISFKLSVPID